MTNIASANALPDERRTTLRWIVHLAALAVLVVFSLYLFRHSVATAYEVWVVSPTFQHCFLILPLAVWLIWRRGDVVAALSPSAEPLVLLLLLPLLALWLVGMLTMITSCSNSPWSGCWKF